ncbi:hypothetical protein BC739_001763 [Kutzneria viridogrisea]|uniref:Uncharacterized protein n=1 Tax=Kutzneria viridogrisea TaxID=47990 RepID=A0ABR6BCG1_9PSEU|nr:hypothetical protein [Kutzneria viridogrisea]
MSTVMSKTGKSRFAGPSITGYAYQFDLTTLEILRSAPGDVITVEGCEDIDIDGSAGSESVQCKYLSSVAYSPASIRDAVRPMFDAYVGGRKHNYRLYAHFADGRLAPSRLTVADLREVLTEHKRKPPETIRYYEGVSERDMRDFVEQFTITSGPSYDLQRAAVRDELRAAFGGTLDDAEQLHYGNAMAAIVELAIQRNEPDRRITKAQFVERVNRRPVLFSRWYAEFVGEEKVLQKTQQRLKGLGVFCAPKKRVIVVDVELLDQGNSVAQMIHLVEVLSTELYGRGRLKNAKPWTMILEGSSEGVLTLKKQLAASGARFNDGYEHLTFNPSVFEALPLVNTKNGGDMIEATSYGIRLVSGDTYARHRQEIEMPDAVVSFGSSDFSRYFSGAPKCAVHVPVGDVEAIITFMKGVAAR